MGRITEKAFREVVNAKNGYNTCIRGYTFLRAWLPASFEEDSPYGKNDTLYVHMLGASDSIYSISLLQAFGFDITPPDFPVTVSYNVAIKKHQLVKLCEMIEEEFPDECTEVQCFLEANPNYYNQPRERYDASAL